MTSGPSEPVPPRETFGSDDAVDPEAELLWGTPIRVVSWIALPALIVIIGVLAGTFLLQRVYGEFGLLGWIQLAAATVFVAVGVVLAWAGFLAYSRITVTDTTRFLKVSVIGVAILSSALVVRVYLRWLVSGARQHGFPPIPSRFTLSAFSCTVSSSRRL